MELVAAFLWREIHGSRTLVHVDICMVLILVEVVVRLGCLSEVSGLLMDSRHLLRHKLHTGERRVFVALRLQQVSKVGRESDGKNRDGTVGTLAQNLAVELGGIGQLGDLRIREGAFEHRFVGICFRLCHFAIVNPHLGIFRAVVYHTDRDVGVSVISVHNVGKLRVHVTHSVHHDCFQINHPLVHQIVEGYHRHHIIRRGSDVSVKNYCFCDRLGLR